MRSDVDMQNRNILVLGASSGIGYAVTENFAQRGGTLFIAARRKEQLQGLQHKYGQVQGIWDCDLSVASNVKQIFIDLSKKGIKLDGMVFCAGTAYSRPIRSYDEEQFQQMLDINLKSFLAAVKYFVSKKYSNEQSAVTVISSVSTQKPEKGRGEYAATKGALNALVPIIAKEVMDRKIRVNAVSPGFVKTEIYDREKVFFDVDSYINEFQPLGLIEPEAVAEVISFLHSDAAKYITGQNIFMDAGNLLY